VPVEGHPVGGGEDHIGQSLAERHRYHAVGDHRGHVPVLDKRRRGKPGALQVGAGFGADEGQPLAGPPGRVHRGGQVKVSPAVGQDGGAVGQQPRRVLAEHGGMVPVGLAVRGGPPADRGDEFTAGERAVVEHGQYGVHRVPDVIVGRAGGDQQLSRAAQRGGRLPLVEVPGRARRENHSRRGGEKRARALRDHVPDRLGGLLDRRAADPPPLEREGAPVEDQQAVFSEPHGVGQRRYYRCRHPRSPDR
jgi:hypothetical protein